MDNAFQWVLSTLSCTWTFLTSYTYHGVTLGAYLIGLFILTILVERIFG